MIQEAEIVPYTSEEDAKKYLQELLNELNKQQTSNKQIKHKGFSNRNSSLISSTEPDLIFTIISNILIYY